MMYALGACIAGAIIGVLLFPIGSLLFSERVETIGLALSWLSIVAYCALMAAALLVGCTPDPTTDPQPTPTVEETEMMLSIREVNKFYAVLTEHESKRCKIMSDEANLTMSLVCVYPTPTPTPYHKCGDRFCEGEK